MATEEDIGAFLDACNQLHSAWNRLGEIIVTAAETADDEWLLMLLNATANMMNASEQVAAYRLGVKLEAENNYDGMSEERRKLLQQRNAGREGLN